MMYYINMFRILNSPTTLLSYSDIVRAISVRLRGTSSFGCHPISCFIIDPTFSIALCALMLQAAKLAPIQSPPRKFGRRRRRDCSWVCASPVVGENRPWVIRRPSSAHVGKEETSLSVASRRLASRRVASRRLGSKGNPSASPSGF